MGEISKQELLEFFSEEDVLAAQDKGVELLIKAKEIGVPFLLWPATHAPAEFLTIFDGDEDWIILGETQPQYCSWLDTQSFDAGNDPDIYSFDGVTIITGSH